MTTTMITLAAPMTAQLLQCLVQPGQAVRAGTPLLLLEAMKMEHELTAPADGLVAEILYAAGEQVREGEVLLRLRPQGGAAAAAPAETAAAAPVGERADLQALRERQALTLDAARPEAIAKRHALGLRSARENIADLVDPGSFREYGALAYAAQRARRPLEELRAQTPADGIVTGLAEIHGRAVAVLAYDATVLAGTQGLRNHQKTDRLLELALRQRLPVVLFAEGGGGRPGDTDMPVVAGLHVPTFMSFARLAGQVPVIGIAAGRCFAGNAALLGCCDLIVATRDANIGLGGPAMVEGGGLGRFAPEQIGPASEQAAVGGVDVLVADEAEACAVARRLLGYFPGFQGARPDWQAADQSALRHAIPEQRARAYEVRPLIETLMDSGSVQELRPRQGASLVCGLARLEGRPLAFVASDCAVLGGAIDAAAMRKLGEHLRLCETQDLPLVALIDTPGFMVGPQAEAQGQVRLAGQLFQAAARLKRPVLSVVLRRAFGLGAMALAGGSLHAPLASLAWPGAEFGAMGLEGAVRLGYRKELAAVPEGAERQGLFERLLARQVEAGRAIPLAEALEIDAVIDPAETRAWLSQGLRLG